ncbi:MAG: aminotransferase class I/II-fold pyridoxal phosphate-dependent enzyme [Hyphomicrobiaceae bacterium]
MTEPAARDIFARAIHSPFPRLKALIEGVAPGASPIDMTVGEPRHAQPAFLMEALATHQSEFGKYPAIVGLPELRGAIAGWIGRRYDLAGRIDPDANVHILCGSREGLFTAIFPALDRRPPIDRPAVLIPNPFYQAYIAAALGAGVEPVFLPALPETGFLPDLDALEKDRALLARTIAFYLCSPSNPQGTVASETYLERAIALCRANDIMLFCDECYSEVYADRPPPGALEVALKRTGSLANLLVFNSLSKRSNLPGLRSGFAAGDAGFIARLSQFRNVVAPQMPLPVQWASAAVWSDEAHVEASRAIYKAKFELSERLLGNRFGAPRPEGGFFLWLDLDRLGTGEDAALTLWKACGVKVLPGAYLTYRDGGVDPGSRYVRIALVHDLATTEEALKRLVSVAA